MALLQPKSSRFFDGDDETRGTPVQISLRRVTTEGAEEWVMLKRVGYTARSVGGESNVDLIVPASGTQESGSAQASFTTDLTSVPQLFTWLVPRSGTHLPAALLHDGLVSKGRQEHQGPPVDRIEADRIFREAMADVETPLLRRWIIWAAVSLPSVWTIRSKALAVVMYAALGAIAVLGYLATLDLFDQIDVLPWMGARPWNRELMLGGLMAIAVPIVVCLPWLAARRGLYRAGLIVGWTVAVLFHVTIAVVAVSTLFQWGEYLAQKFTRSGRPVRILPALGATIVLVAVSVLTIWLCLRTP